jgi:dipeptidyl aminopeptidase/acylaminoacyl peptidase
VTEIQRPDTTQGETALRWPEFLPDGRHFLFVTLPPRNGNFDVFASSIGSSGRRRVLVSGAAPVCAGDENLIVASNGRLMCQRFDFRAMKPLGEPVALGPSTVTDVSVGERLASASMNGVLIQPSAAIDNTQLLWLDRSGRSHGELAIPPGRYEKLLFSPDGGRLLAVRRSSATHVGLWMIDVMREQATPLSSDSQSRIGGYLAWSPDGNRVAFSSNRSGPTNIYQKLTNEPAPETPLYQSPNQFKEVDSWSPDGRFLCFSETDRITGWDVWLLPVEGERPPVPYLRESLNQNSGTFSPDGRWLCYASDETGRSEIYVQSFPTPGTKHVITTTGAEYPRWSRDGREIFFQWDNAVWAVPARTSPVFEARAPRRLFGFRRDALWITPTPDHQRFVESVPVTGGTLSTITVVLNWRAGLGR